MKSLKNLNRIESPIYLPFSSNISITGYRFVIYATNKVYKSIMKLAPDVWNLYNNLVAKIEHEKFKSLQSRNT